MDYRVYRFPQWFRRYFSGFTWQMPAQDKVLYLTFDDGPIPDITEWVLETLKAFEAKGTFFCVGDNIRKYPHIYTQVISEGHSVGNHTFHHLKGWQTHTADYLEDTALCANIMEQYRPSDFPSMAQGQTLFRPPYGRISRTQYRALAAQYNIILWSLLTYDFDRLLSPEICLQRALKHTQAGDIVVFHDSIKAEPRLRYVLPRYLAHFANQGYRFAAL